ncbi:helix-hairpin-helix domain-containing protein [Paenibacillus sp. KQZ6P-2]|uniref:Helix-hairpin-helix domain-containing protein n=1 Tax=Paenibacillus mangrovi TaxID=2931978 RepID=A0A9X1WT60_9BACL|nr:helix-hairpin-helix domain-containing protein [Paenibacillus mangrovi]MCJ8014543.1 helix-hairpin-helix domain-containing protein [Paenibacillus mangrovi]
MNNRPAPKLPLTPEEKNHMRSFKIRLHSIAELETSDLAGILGSTQERAGYLRAMAQFQRVPSIGPRIAERVATLGYLSLDELKPLKGPHLLEQLENHYGFWEDPCLEDALWCMIYHANHPGSEKCWFDFTDARKEYRKEHGYPESRPKTAWYEVKTGE